jgi:TrmH family RNA methyltransferase
MTKPPLCITSLQNPRIKNLVKWRQRRARDKQGVILIEEPLVIRRAWLGGCTFHTIYFCPELLTGAAERTLLEDLRGESGQPWEFIQVTAAVLTKVAYRKRSGGLLVVGAQTRLQLSDLTLGDPPLLIVLAGLEKPGNLGAILRSADGAGVHGVLLCNGGSDIYNPNVLRASRGTVFTVPTVEASGAEIRRFLSQQGIATVAATPTAEQDFTACDLGGPVAVVLGREDRGLSAAWLAESNHQVRIPMSGMAASLNVATTTALLLFEAVRQRSRKRGGPG